METVDKISIRIGNDFHSYYNGQIGYEIFKKHRWSKLAYKACTMVLPLRNFTVWILFTLLALKVIFLPVKQSKGLG